MPLTARSIESLRLAESSRRVHEHDWQQAASASATAAVAASEMAFSASDAHTQPAKGGSVRGNAATGGTVEDRVPAATEILMEGALAVLRGAGTSLRHNKDDEKRASVGPPRLGGDDSARRGGSGNRSESVISSSGLHVYRSAGRTQLLRCFGWELYTEPFELEQKVCCCLALGE